MRNIKTVVAAAFFITMLFASPVTAKAESCGETVRKETEAELKAINYETNETIGALLAPSRYSAIDTLNKKTEIAKREGKKPAEISDDQAVKELNQDNLKATSYEAAFAQVQEDIGSIIQRMVDSAEVVKSQKADFYTDKIRQNKEKLLLGITYLYRLYDFDMGGHNIKDVFLYESSLDLSNTYIKNVLDWMIYIGGYGGEQLKISNNALQFDNLFWPVTTAGNLKAYLEQSRKKWIPNTTMDEWFLQESPADILVRSSAWSNQNTGLYSRLSNDDNFKSYILPLLTVSEDSVYVIANSATITFGIVDCYIKRNLKESDPSAYASAHEKFLQQLEQTAKQQVAFLDFWHKIAKSEKQNLLSSNRIVLDSLRIDDPDDPNSRVQWSDKFGENASKGVREFFTPLNLYRTYMQLVDGEAEGTGVRYFTSKALTERGLATYAHELTHLLVSEVMLNGYGSRDGMLAEVYTRGMFEPYEINDPPAFNLNLIYDRLSVNDRYHNGQPERFQSETDLKDYMSGILDVVYTLDYAEADVILTKSTEEKKKWFHKLEQIEDSKDRDNQGESGSKHNLDSVRELTLDEAKELNTIDDLIRNSIITSRYEVNGTQTTGTLASNGYYVVPLFSANYAGVQNNSGVSGDVMIRRQAFELLAEYGYYDGMVPYISNQYKAAATLDGTILSDQYILKKIFGGTYETMADFKKAMFQKRIEKTNKLKPVTITWNNKSVTINNFEELCLLMKEAVESDLIETSINIRAQATKVERLKQEIFKAYLLSTEDFKESIYGTAQTPEKPTDPEVTPGGGTDENPGETDPVTPPENPGGTNTEPPKGPDNTGSQTTQKPSNTGSQTTQKPGNTGSQTTQTPGSGSAANNTSGTNNKNVKPSLLLCKVSAAKTSQTISWNKVKSADGYEIYGAKGNGKYKCLGVVSTKSNKWKHKKLKKGTQYKYYVTAYRNINGKQVTVSKSLTLYSVTKGGKYSNPSKISEKRSLVNVKRGKKVRLRVTLKAKKVKKSWKKIRYASSNPSVAKVSSKGVITGKKRGTCTVYCIAQNGLTKKIKVKVK